MVAAATLPGMIASAKNIFCRSMCMRQIWVIIVLMSTIAFSSKAEDLWIEAENFVDKGGWVLDNQSMEQMGSPLFVGTWIRDSC